MKFILLLITAVILNYLKIVKCIYFKLEEDIEKCFVDELYKGSV